MTPTQFTRAIGQIGWTLRHTAECLDLPPVRIKRWAHGDYPIPDAVAHWLEALARAHKQNPAPKLNDIRTYVRSSPNKRLSGRTANYVGSPTSPETPAS